MVGFIFMGPNEAAHRGQRYFQKISWVKIKLTLMVRENAAVFFMSQNEESGHDTTRPAAARPFRPGSPQRERPRAARCVRAAAGARRFARCAVHRAQTLVCAGKRSHWRAEPRVASPRPPRVAPRARARCAAPWRRAEVRSIVRGVGVPTLTTTKQRWSWPRRILQHLGSVGG